MKTNPSEPLDQVDEAIVKATRDLEYYRWLEKTEPRMRSHAMVVADEIDELLFWAKTLQEERN
jgi:inhibitor of KinA sporulation pathway (predicted exonuclease)